MSLIFYFFTNNYGGKKAFQNFINFVAKRHSLLPNYIGEDETKCQVVITGPMLATFVSLTPFVQLCKYPQLTYGPFNPILSDSEQFPYLYQMASKDTFLPLAMVSLILHFSWNWVGLALSDNDQGNQFLSDLRGEMEPKRVCLAFVIMIPGNTHLYISRAEVYNNQIMTSSTNVIIYGDTDSTLAVCFIMWKLQGIQKLWFTTSQWHVITSKRDFTLDSFHGTLTFVHHHAEISGFKNYIQIFNPSKYTDSFLARLGWMYFSCDALTSRCKKLENCSLNASLEWLMLQRFDMALSDDSYDVYNAVYSMKYANTEQNHCLQKDVIFLSFDDPLGLALSCMALCLSAFTALILGVFVKHQDTPIVKAKYLILSYILLVSLIFCFLSSLLFIGYPSSATCILQQTTYGVVFTVTVSTVLAKTITVVLAFKVTAPRRRMKWLLVSGAPNYIIPICTIIQIILCAIWLGASLPSVDIDAHSEHSQIIIVCNKGSVTTFYCVLGYLGFLALGSFTVAFLARNLPDTFNEAKFLTFSMLLFCSVWVTFFPVCHSTKGKVMVAVEVFIILASSAGLLGCIFVPKCYIILLRPERNSLQKLKRKQLPELIFHNF
ncbi:Vomeronasal type-2 receptor 116 [Microtus ochrogaster]|uniref:Vomeronasal type-2 receptor 116 n=1 Tax=Microtus ochrogaster TaxID=79684 RepID=A0A8J6KJ44_MICOH|nr:Vomeronasal type-2 receptor 116 [Microtus ochrogaster]